ncbi:MAG: invasion associated locus B family protein [Alphaproteobacteria bacterium]|nr:invasion associated locus B family protein [Alphaproteobacteria bacterium]
MRFVLLMAVLLAATAAGAQGAPLTILGTFSHWTAYTLTDAAGKVCYVASEPSATETKAKGRDDVFLMITHRPQKNEFDVLSMKAGYTYQKGSRPTIKIDANRVLSLKSYEDSAWSPNAETDGKLIAQMKKGGKAVVSGTSVRGTKTADTFSLRGLTKALEAADKACERK